MYELDSHRERTMLARQERCTLTELMRAGRSVGMQCGPVYAREVLPVRSFVLPVVAGVIAGLSLVMSVAAACGWL